MVTDRNEVLKTANASIKNVSDVRDACKTAYENVYSVLQLVSNNWQSESGNAMANALYDLYKQLQSAYNDLDTATINLQKEVKSVYNSLADVEF